MFAVSMLHAPQHHFHHDGKFHAASRGSRHPQNSPDRLKDGTDIQRKALPSR
jgi:hypothetical protein